MESIGIGIGDFGSPNIAFASLSVHFLRLRRRQWFNPVVTCGQMVSDRDNRPISESNERHEFQNRAAMRDRFDTVSATV